LVLIILILLIVGGAFLLSSRVTEQPTHQIEVDVTSNAAAG
jgi:hypothetical protein